MEERKLIVKDCTLEFLLIDDHGRDGYEVRIKDKHADLFEMFDLIKDSDREDLLKELLHRIECPHYTRHVEKLTAGNSRRVQ